MMFRKPYKFKCSHCYDGDVLRYVENHVHTYSIDSVVLDYEGKIEDVADCEERSDVPDGPGWYECDTCQHKYTLEELVENNLITVCDDNDSSPN